MTKTAKRVPTLQLSIARFACEVTPTNRFRFCMLSSGRRPPTSRLRMKVSILLCFCYFPNGHAASTDAFVSTPAFPPLPLDFQLFNSQSPAVSLVTQRQCIDRFRPRPTPDELRDCHREPPAPSDAASSPAHVPVR
jgi:hypothetical protein